FKWYKKAAKQGHEGAKFSLGCCYIDGVGTFPIKFIGRKLIITSAEQGYAEAQEYLGTVYYVGHGGIYADYKKMVEWYTKAAAQGYADAIMKLARCYEDGDGVKEDKAKAAELYRQAAEGFRKMYKQGDIRAKWKLEKLTDDNKI
ncbi:MAG: sel1 repeat family protein, partial [Treponema sp.]|nr:sel1 repeat family protein [Treponema sp.]